MNDLVYLILKMSVFIVGYAMLTALLWTKTRGRALQIKYRILIGLLYGGCAILSTHFGVDYYVTVINVRDMAPLCAGLLFDPLAGIIAGVIGGAERYIAGTCLNVGVYTTVACSISTCIAGFEAALLSKYLFKGRIPSVVYAAFVGATVEVFHMYAIFFTHLDDIVTAFEMLKICALPMILSCAVGLSLTAGIVRRIGGKDAGFRILPERERPLSQRFQFWLFVVTALVVAANFSLNYMFQTNYSWERSESGLRRTAYEISNEYSDKLHYGGDTSMLSYGMDNVLSFCLVDRSGEVIAYHDAYDYEGFLSEEEFAELIQNEVRSLSDHRPGETYIDSFAGNDYMCRVAMLEGASRLLVMMPMIEVYSTREMMSYVGVLGNIVLFSVIFIMAAMLVQQLVVEKLRKVNGSLEKITNGDLDEVVSVYDAAEFTSLSNDINHTVDVLKGFIADEEKRMEEELLLARDIQDSALPKNFDYNHTGFEIYATMDPAREVGGDFYDFFFIDIHRLALVIADVSGKGIPASLLMMRCKSAIRSLAETDVMPAEAFARVNDELCIGNEASMFVTAWMGIIDFRTGLMTCVSAGHEYPAIMRSGGSFELFKDKHRLPLGGMEGMRYVEYELQLHPGDVIFVYTDGLPEGVNPDVEQYGTDRMIAALNKGISQGDGSEVSMKDLLAAVHDDLHAFEGTADQFDDETMLGFRYNG